MIIKDYQMVYHMVYQLVVLKMQNKLREGQQDMPKRAPHDQAADTWQDIVAVCPEVVPVTEKNARVWLPTG